MQEITYVSALVAGIISFISPCVLPLVPPYLCYMAGASIDQLTDGDSATNNQLRNKVIANSLLFVLGFSSVFIALGAGASTIGQWLRYYQDMLASIAGIVIILMGLHFLGLFRIGLLYREARFTSKGTGLLGSYTMGLAFAFGWTPCIGPILGAILAVASTSESVGQGAVLLAVYSAGLGIPFMVAALFVKPFLSWLGRFKQHLDRVEKVMGGLLVVTGILFITGGMQTMAYRMLEMFPSLANIG